MLTRENTFVVLVDVQTKLTDVMWEKASLVDALMRLARGAAVLGVPVVWTEQTPEKMGPTIEPLRDLLLAAGGAPIAKSAFSCCGESAFMRRVEELGRPVALVAGIESHVCVYQTAADLCARGYGVQVVSDAVSSRTAANRRLGLDRAAGCGAACTGVEMALFEMLRTAADPRFRDVLRIVK